MALDLCMERGGGYAMESPERLCGAPEIAVDTRACVIDMGPAAERIIGADLAHVRGIPVGEAITDAALRALVVHAMTHGGPARGRVPTGGGPAVLLAARARALQDRAGRDIGAVVRLTGLRGVSVPAGQGAPNPKRG
jgi:hypothetical protein